MKNIRLFLLCLALGLLGVSSLSLADAIDIYSKKDDKTTPNVLLILDNAANFSADAGKCKYVDGTTPTLDGTAGGIEQCAIYNLVSSLPAGSVNLGLMVYNGSNIRDINNANCDSGNGGCLVQPLALMSGTAKTNFLAWIKTWKTTAGGAAGDGYIKASGEATGATMQEAWAYYAGQTGLSGRDYAGVQPTAGCQKNFVIFIGNAFNASGTPGEGASDSPSAALASAPGVTATQLTNITIPSGSYGTASFSCKDSYTMPSHTNSSGLFADEWARYMYQTDIYGTLDDKQGITTYTVGLLGPSCKPDYPALLTSMAKHGGGKYFATSNYGEIAAALMKILNEIQATNSVFSSASLPVSVNAQGTYLNQIFLGMFRPDASANPRWVGNLKQYQFILEYPDPTNPDPNKATLKLGDSLGNPAISSAGTGFITPSAVSFWTKKDLNTAPDSTGGFYKNDVRGTGGAFDSPDGEVVEKGGAAQQLRLSNLSVVYASTPSTPRRLYTYCLSDTCSNASLTDSSNAFATTNLDIIDAQLGVANSTDRTSLINWVRGEDNIKDAELGPGSLVTVRPSIHGDVLHSRPVAINFGTDAAPKVVVFYGGNDGVFRAINGNQTTALSSGGVSVLPGGELWGLVLPEHFGKLNRQRVNSPELKFPSTPLALVDAQPKDYFVDGSPGLYQKLKADGTVDKAYLYLTMRRGGRFIYALDVSDPIAPTVLWKKSYTDSTDSAFGELGQTWSRPRVTLVKGYANPVLVFGAGYDPAEDAEPPSAGTMGRGIFVLDAVTGVRVWSAAYTADGTTACTGNSTQAACAVSGMNWAIPADISFVDRDNDGKTDRFYAADLGGNVWRVDLEPNAGDTPDKWQVNKLAALGCPSGSCSIGTTPRKFFFPPNVVPVGATGVTGSYDVVLLGSGDREHPLQGRETNRNRFYALKDSKTGKDASGITAITDADLSNAPVMMPSGFYITFAPGEKVVNASTTLRGTTFFGTNKPTPPSVNSCASNLGEAKGYALDPFKGTSSSTVYDGGGLPPSPTSGIVTILLPGGNSVKKEFCIGCGGGGSAAGGGASPPCNSALEACTLTQKVPTNPRRSYWYKK